MPSNRDLKIGAIKGAITSILSEGVLGMVAGMQHPINEFLKYRKDPEMLKSIDWVSLFKPYLDQPLQTFTNGLSADLFQQAQPVCFGVFLVTFCAHLLSSDKTKPLENASSYGAHGTSRWATKEEIFDKKDITFSLMEEGLILARYGKKPIILKDKGSTNKNVAVFGGSGAGKSTSLIIPNILNIRNKSIIVTDPKGELYELTAEAKRKQGYKVRLVNFKDIHCSDRYNPMDYIKSPTDARKVSQTLILNTMADGQQPKGDFWDKAEVSLISALMLYVKYFLPESQQHLGSVFELLKSSYEEIDALFMALDEYHIARRAYDQAISKLEDKTRASVFATASVTMDLWKYPEVCEFTYTSDLTFESIGKEPTIVYVVLPVAEDDFRPLISTFFSQLFTELYALADRNYNKLPVPTIFLLDEFNNIGRIPRFEERLSTTRSYGISVMMIIQSIGQLRDRWSKNKADELLDNCDTRIYLGANNHDSVEYFSKLIGKTTIKVQSDSHSSNKHGGSEGVSHSYSGRPLITPDELLRIDHDTAIVLIKGKYPMKVEKAWFYRMKEINSLLAGPCSRYDYPMEDRTIYDVINVKEFIDELIQKQESELQELLNSEGLEIEPQEEEIKAPPLPTEPEEQKPVHETKHEPKIEEKQPETNDKYDELEFI
jgi:type IV secretion system protein VirD4